MHTSGSIIKSCIERVRMLLNESTLDAKYTDDLLVRSVLSHAVGKMVVKANGIRNEPIICRMTLSLAAGTEYYQLPSFIQQVVRICKYGTNNRLEWDWRPSNEFHAMGPGWTLEGPTLRTTPVPTEAQNLTLCYVPSGLFDMHYATTGNTLALTQSINQFQLASTPALGLCSKVQNGYVGAVLRVLASTHHERVISAYNADSRTVTFRNPLVFGEGIPATGPTTPYEILPMGHCPFWFPAGSMAAAELGIGRKITQSHMAMIRAVHQDDLKAMRDTLSTFNGRMPMHVARDTIDNPDGGGHWGTQFTVLGS